jgi:A/G-specific adenine glycosylase
MLQQTQVKTVVPYWERWMAALPTSEALARARESRVLKLWESLGYYRRARNLHAAAKLLVREHGSRFPTSFKDVLALPGVGRYTAGAICSIAYNQPTPALDGNVARVLRRLFGLRGDRKNRKNQARLWSWADQLVRAAADEPSRGRRNCGDLNQALMELGAVLCTPRNPCCPECPLRRNCAAARSANSGPLRATSGRTGTPPPPTFGHLLHEPESRAGVSPAQLRPLRHTRPIGLVRDRRDARPTLSGQPSIAKHVVAVVLERQGRFLVRQRPSDGVNGGLWEFPNQEVTARRSADERAIRQLAGRVQDRPEKLLRLKHSITRYRITLDVYRVKVAGARVQPYGGARWCSLAQLRRLAFPCAHRRIVEHLQRAAKVAIHLAGPHPREFLPGPSRGGRLPGT